MRLPWQREEAQPSEASLFIPLGDPAAVDAFLASAAPAPSLLLIHDPSCGISARAFREIASTGETVHLVVTGDGQHLSARVAAATGIRHESPQAFVLAGGTVQWHASHFSITQRAVREALAAARRSPGKPA